LHPGFSPGEYVQMTVKDTGCGIDKDVLPNIFEPFYTTKGIGQGTGLGLSTVYGAVKQNKGFILAASPPEGGASFTIYLPRHVGPVTGSESLVAAVPSSKGNETILVVEDERSILTMIRMILERQGYTVIAANSPEEAMKLAAIQKTGIDLLITDVIMPEMNGKDLHEHIQLHHPKIRTIYMSGYTANVISPHGVITDGMNFIQKPFSKKDLTARIREVLDRNNN
jgi:CheY-like chemotaxis protein